MKLRKNIFSAISLLVLVNFASADTFVMKDGSTINGSIISETNTHYLLRAEVTNNVYAEKTVLKSTVSEIKKTDPSIAAYKKLTSILPTSDLMDEKDYAVIFKSQLLPFLKKYPASPHFKDAETILNTLRQEYQTVKSGGIKLEGKLLTAEQIEANKYDVQAAKEYQKFMGYVGKKQYRAALSTLERLEDGYPDAKHCRKAQQTALAILPLYEEKLQKLYDGADTLMQKRERALGSMTSGEKNRTERIFEQEEQQYQRMLDQITAKKKKTKWLPINPYFKEPIESNLKMVTTEIKRINIASEKPTMDVGKLYRDTYAALENGNYSEAKVHFDKFTRTKPPIELVEELAPQLEEAKSVMERLLILKKEEDALAKKKAAEDAKIAAQAKKDAAGDAKVDDRTIRDKLNLNKKQNTIDRIPQ